MKKLYLVGVREKLHWQSKESINKTKSVSFKRFQAIKGLCLKEQLRLPLKKPLSLLSLAWRRACLSVCSVLHGSFPCKVIIIKHDLFNFPKISTCGFNRECWLYFHRHAMRTRLGWGPLSPQGKGDTHGARDSRQSGNSCVAPDLGKGRAFQLLKFNGPSPCCRTSRIKSNKYLLAQMEPVQIPGKFLALGARDVQPLHTFTEDREGRL